MARQNEANNGGADVLFLVLSDNVYKSVTCFPGR